ncbi:MAG: DegT/DnrJ/EryC1/StrS family aminotransferase, partial [Candidatus Neomarinimicrobiota bacterium]
AHGAIYDGRKVGALGLAGCFSFQSSKNMTSGEGGLLLTNSREAYERAFHFYNCGRPVDGPWHEHLSPGLNLRLSAFQAAVLLHQMDHLEEWAATREANGRYLEEQLNALPGITCAGRYAETGRNAYHLFIFTYDAAEFDGLPKARFLEALNAEGVPATEGYRPLPTLPFLDGKEGAWTVTERVCRDGVWLRQWELLAERELMDGIVEAVEKVRAGAGRLGD